MNRLLPFALVVLAAAPAAAQRAPRRHHGGGAAASAAPPPSNDTEAPTSAPPDTDTLIEIIQSAAVTSSPAGAHAISALLLRGVAPRAAAAGLDALGVMARPEGAPAVLRFLEHRRPTLRRHAIAAAVAIHTPELVTALVGRLGDSNEDVRVEAAAALGEVGGHAAARPLFEALQRDMETLTESGTPRLLHECAKAIARVGNADDITRLLTFLRRAPFQSMSDALRAAIGRRDLPEPFRVHVVQAIGDLATREVREFLQSVIADAHGQETPVVRAARVVAERIAE